MILYVKKVQNEKNRACRRTDVLRAARFLRSSIEITDFQGIQALERFLYILFFFYFRYCNAQFF